MDSGIPSAKTFAQRKYLVTYEIFSWLGLGDGNITFSDELDFDVAELDIVYEDNDEEASQ